MYQFKRIQPIAPTTPHDCKPRSTDGLEAERAYNLAIAHGQPSEASEPALRKVVENHLRRYPSGINPDHKRESILPDPENRDS